MTWVSVAISLKLYLFSEMFAAMRKAEKIENWLRLKIFFSERVALPPTLPL